MTAAPGGQHAPPDHVHRSTRSESVLPKSRRTDIQRLTGQLLLPVIEFVDTAYRENSADIAARIRAAKLFEGRDSDAAAQ